MNPVLQFDYYLRTRSDSELSRRVESLLKTAKKEHGERKTKQEALQKAQKKERAKLEKSLAQVEQEEAHLRNQLALLNTQRTSLIERIKQSQLSAVTPSPANVVVVNRMDKTDKMGKTSANKQNTPTKAKPQHLSELDVSLEMLLEMLPLFYELKRGMLGTQHDLEVYFRYHVPSLTIRIFKGIASLVLEKRHHQTDPFFLKSSFIDPETLAVDFSKELEYEEDRDLFYRRSRELREKEKGLEEKAGEALPPVQVKAIVAGWEREENERRERLLAMMPSSGLISMEQLMSGEMLQAMGVSSEEMLAIISRFLHLDSVRRDGVC